MSNRQLFVLGTASQVPTRYRNHNAYFLEWDGRGLLFDPGEGTQRQMTLFGVAAGRIHHIFITHFHGDHCLGLAGIIQRLSLDKITRPVHVYYPASGQKYLDRLRNASIFHDVTQLVLHPIKAGGTIFQEADFSLEAQPLDHGVPCFGYRVQEPDGVRMLPEKLRAAGVRGPKVGILKKEGRLQLGEHTILLSEVSTKRPGQSMAFVMDTRSCDGAHTLARDADLLVCESTYLQSEATEARERGHLTALEAARIAKASGVRRLVLTHFSQRYPSVEPFVAEAQTCFDEVVAVKDGDVVPVPPRKEP